MIDALGDGVTELVIGAGGTMLSIGMQSGAPLGPLDTARMIFAGTTVRGFWIIPWLQSRTPEQLQSAFGAVLALLAAGKLMPPVEAEYDLANLRAAIEHAQPPGRHGKLLLRG